MTLQDRTGDRAYDLYLIFNAWSVPVMHLMRATWGGSLAMRREVYDRAYFFERMWDTSSEESAMQDATRHAGLRLEVHAKTMMMQRDASMLRNASALYVANSFGLGYITSVGQ